jgi:membrane protease YdiL (CAAX protease family)
VTVSGSALPPPVRQELPLWQAALFVLLGGVAAQLAGGVVSGLLRVWLLAHGQGTTPLNASAILIVPSMLASALCLIAVACIAPATAGVPLRLALGLRRASASCFAAAAIGTVMLGPTADCMMRGMQALFPKLNLGLLAMLHQLVRDIPWLVAWPAFALLPGISEELLFRGLLQTAAARGRFAIAISALSFSLFHLDPHHIAGVLPLGFFLAWVASRCGTWVTIFAHIVNNTAAIAAVHSPTFDVGYGTEAEMPWAWLPSSLLIVALCAWTIVRESRALGVSAAPYSDAAEP